MLSFLPGPVLGVITSTLLVLNLVFWMSVFFVVALAKLLVPIRSWRQRCMRGLSWVGTKWIDGNSLVASLHDIDWHVTGSADSLRSDAWYLVLANHQAWADVFVLQHVFNHRIPFLKFFIKQELIWVPLLGFAWWAMEMPFMRRHSKAALQKNPALRQQDLEATRKMCEGIRHTPTTITMFAEGTRFSQAKREQRRSPYRYLLRPKSGGLGLVFGTLGDTLTSIVDVTIAYPHDGFSFWDLLSGRADRIVVDLVERPVPAEVRRGDLDDADFRERLREWIDGVWEEKDARMAALLEIARPAATGDIDE